jgi:GTP cyclohydrolase III
MRSLKEIRIATAYKGSFVKHIRFDMLLAATYVKCNESRRIANMIRQFFCYGT